MAFDSGFLAQALNTLTNASGWPVLRSVVEEIQMRDGPAERRGALSLVCLASFLVLMDNSIVNVALPSIQRSLGFVGGDVQWVLTGYALSFGGFMLVGGRLGDVVGPRRVFVTGLGLFALASLIGGLALSPWMLIAARIAQGLGAAALSPSALALLVALFPAGPQRNRALALYAAMAVLGLVTGMVAGGVLTYLAGWRWVMFVNVPIAMTALALTPWAIPAIAPVRPRPRVDVAGAGAVTLGLVALLYALENAAHTGWESSATLAWSAVGVGLLCVFAVLQRYTAAPLIPPLLWGVRTVGVANLVMLLKSSMGIAMLFIPTLYFQEVLGYSPLTSGLLFVPVGAVGVIAGLTGGRIVQRLGSPRRVVAVGLVLQIVGLILMTVMPLHVPWPLLAGLLLVFTGYLWADVALTIMATAGLAEAARGVGTAVFRTAAQLGGALGLGVIATVITAGAGTVRGTADPAVLVAGLQAGLWCGVAFAVAALLLVTIALRPPPRP